MTLPKLALLGIAVVAAIGIAAYFARDNALDPSQAKAAADVNSTQAGPTLTASQTGMSSAAAGTPSLSRMEIDRLTYNTASFKAAPLSARLDTMSSRRPGRSFDPKEVAEALKSDKAWEVDASVAAKLPLNDEDRKDGRAFVRTDPLKIEALMPGDEMDLPIYEAKASGPLRMVVDRVEDDGKGNLTWYGHLKDFQTENQVSFTRGENLIVGGVTVPDKNYVIQIHDNIGWVANGFTLFKTKAIDDAIIPPDEGGHSGGHRH
ncbi:MAG: hypothetical protein K0S28_1966 [Paucimonas sp.]|jgi:hypothetical protein|nr:hypothetical protein [Paucimonas sp.]